MKSDKLNYYHTNVVIPNMIMANKHFFVTRIINNPKNAKFYIGKDSYDRACEALKIKSDNYLDVLLTANIFNEYFVVFAKFPKNYVVGTNPNIAIAIAVKNEEVRYFTLELGKNFNDKDEYLVGEWKFINDKIDSHLNYGNINKNNMSLFAGKIKDILER